MKNSFSKACLIILLLWLPLFASAQHLKELKAWAAKDAKSRGAFREQPFADAVLSEKEAAEATQILWQDSRQQLKAALAQEWQNKAFQAGSHTLKFKYKVFGEQPADGRSLYISMHGGGNASPEVNDQQWENQIRLYTPAEGVYVAPRAPTDTWDLWHQSHIDTLFDKLIEAAIVFEGVNPNKVYLMGYSAGGDGVYQLAPRMADHWAAAAMMAGHPNEASPVNLRNIGFTIHVGALDDGFNRNAVAQKWSLLLDSLQQQDPEGYKYFVQLHTGRAHWMNREDSVAVPWMAAFRRNPVPAKVVWKQDDVHHTSFYWLAVPASSAKTDNVVVAAYKDNTINITRNDSDTLYIRLNDQMVNLNKPVTVTYLGRSVFKGKLKRKLRLMHQTLEERKDPGLVFSSEIMLVNGKVAATSNASELAN
ncbi:hypothetical protein [Pontibacter chitinilyticus]|uniref:hypothetical protein n=1 Tax=Pontibacter chitinilyticus TaxID=2674989 RepID=UPI0032195BEF